MSFLLCRIGYWNTNCFVVLGMLKQGQMKSPGNGGRYQEKMIGELEQNLQEVELQENLQGVELEQNRQGEEHYQD